MKTRARAPIVATLVAALLFPVAVWAQSAPAPAGVLRCHAGRPGSIRTGADSTFNITEYLRHPGRDKQQG
jgi:hypothetical protein